MKKLIILGLSASLLLAGCTSIQRVLRGDEYVDSSLAASASSAEASKKEAETKEALTNKNASFPQLSTKVAKDEAKVKIVTTAGDPKGNGTGGESIWHGKNQKIDSGKGFKNETSAYLYNLRGALSMANAASDNTNGSQFFINQNQTDSSSKLSESKYPAQIIKAYKKGGNPSLDGDYTVFGQVIDGMDIVDKIAESETDENNKPKNEIKIQKIEVIKDYNFKK